MKLSKRRSKRPLPIPQFEFGFSPDIFSLYGENTLDGERISRELAEAKEARREADKAQTRLFTEPVKQAATENVKFQGNEAKALTPAQKPLNRLNTRSRFRVGDVIRHRGKQGEVVHATASIALVAIKRPQREFTTRVGKNVRIQPRPVLALIRLSSKSPTLNRKAK